MSGGIMWLALRHIKSNRKAYKWDIACYALFICIVLLTGILVNSFTQSYMEHLDDTYGSYNVCIINADKTDDVYLNLTSGNTYGECTVTGFVENGGSYISAGYYDDTAYDLMSVSLTDGHLPQNATEIAIEESALYILTRSHSVDDANKITLDLTDFNGNTVRCEFEIVGTVRNYSQRTPVLSGEEAELPYNLFPRLFVCPENTDAPVYSHTLIAYDGNDNRLDTYGDNYLPNQKREEQNPAILYAVFSVIMVLIIALGFVCLLSNVLVHKKKNLELLFVMKCVGASNSSYLRFRAAVLGILLLCSVVIGTVAGLALAWLVILLLRKLFLDYIAFRFSFAAAAVSIFLTAVAIFLFNIIIEARSCKKLPMELNIEKKNSVVSLNVGLKRFTCHPLETLALKTVYAGTSRYFGIIMSIFALLFISIVIQLCAVGIYQSYDKSTDFDYYVRTVNGGTFTALDIPTTNYSFEDRDVLMIADTGEAKCYASSDNKMYVLLEDDDPEPPKYVFEKHINGRPETLIEQTKDDYEKYGYNRNERLYTVKLSGVNDVMMSEILSGTAKAGDIGECAVVVVPQNVDSSYYSVGDEITFTAPRIGSDGTVHRVDIKTTVGAVVVMDENSPFYDTFSYSCYHFIISQQVIDEKIATGYHTLRISLSNPEVYGKTEQVLNQLDVIHAEDMQYSCLSNREYNAEKRQVTLLAGIIGCLIVAAITVYSLITLVTVFRSDLYDRKKVWGYLRAAGMRQKDAITVECISVFFINILAFFMSLMMCAIFLITLAEFDRCFIFSALSPATIILPPIIITSVCILITRAVIKRFWNQKTIELIREL